MGNSAEKLSLQTQLLPWIPIYSITDTDFGLETNQFCNHFGYNGSQTFGKLVTILNNFRGVSHHSWGVCHYFCLETSFRNIETSFEKFGAIMATPGVWNDTTVVSKLTTDRHFFWWQLISNYRYRIGPPGELISIAETDLWSFQQKISQYRFRFSPEFQFLVDVSDIFYFFSAPGRRKGSPRRREGGDDFLLKIPGGGVFRAGGGGGGWGAGRVFAGNLGGGLNIFFRGRNSCQELIARSQIENR